MSTPPGPPSRCNRCSGSLADEQGRCWYCGMQALGTVTDHPEPVPVTAPWAPVQEQAGKTAPAPDRDDPAAEILLALSEPCGLDAEELARLAPDRPPGTCPSCRAEAG